VGQIAGEAGNCSLNKIVTNMEPENGIETYLPFRQKNTASSIKYSLFDCGAMLFIHATIN